ncbi:hypothetical protein B0H11DRAFT_2233246 [Mycena galericulata]|nr:hypothetical protein B0H11DRAFT_2233246 [Mycena galericulata]
MLSPLAHLLNVDCVTPARHQYFPMCCIRLLPKFSSDLDAHSHRSFQLSFLATATAIEVVSMRDCA